MQIDMIREMSKSKRIGDATDSEIVKRFALIFTIIGLRSQHYPTREQDIILISFLRKHYSFRRLDELVYAFELAMKRDLDLDDVKPYDQFTIEYMCRILNAYGQWLSRELKIMIDNQPEPQKIAYQMTDDERMDEINEWMEKQDINFNFVPLYLYDWMVKFGMINHTDDDKFEMYRRATNIWGNELRNNAEFRGDRKPYQRYLQMKNTNFKDINDDELSRIDTIYKKISVVEYHKTIKQQKS